LRPRWPSTGRGRAPTHPQSPCDLSHGVPHRAAAQRRTAGDGFLASRGMRRTREGWTGVPARPVAWGGAAGEESRELAVAVQAPKAQPSPVQIGPSQDATGIGRPEPGRGRHCAPPGTRLRRGGIPRRWPRQADLRSAPSKPRADHIAPPTPPSSGGRLERDPGAERSACQGPCPSPDHGRAGPHVDPVLRQPRRGRQPSHAPWRCQPIGGNAPPRGGAPTGTMERARARRSTLRTARQRTPRVRCKGVTLCLLRSRVVPTGGADLRCRQASPVGEAGGGDNSCQGEAKRKGRRPRGRRLRTIWRSALRPTGRSASPGCRASWPCRRGSG